ncbi:uncharacterized protein B0P05DRAFT_572320 [Gilbertella persicaria]|uniref:uncharacterized protein n=1 Tax=Gilbertella persicaria TaxID=101096 RepID=UPI00221E47A1|nr:uncharacterized protein B0P05DRAFT_572320 [Gilbertella persicaria]KAI8076663.1 hypothetical protein B0P05DRAFT_572320 [Gilbertella persicaria]
MHRRKKAKIQTEEEVVTDEKDRVAAEMPVSKLYEEDSIVECTTSVNSSEDVEDSDDERTIDDNDSEEVEDNDLEDIINISDPDKVYESDGSSIASINRLMHVQQNNSFMKSVYRYYSCLAQKRNVGSSQVAASSLLGETGVCSVMDRFTLSLLDKWRHEKKLGKDDSQYLKLTMSRILDTINKRNPVLSEIGEELLSSFDEQMNLPPYEMPSTVSDFIKKFIEKAKDSSHKDLVIFVKQITLEAWSKNDEELKKVTEIYDYLLLHIDELQKLDKTSSELQCFIPTYHILNIIFRDTGIKLVIGEKGCDASKKARGINERYFAAKKQDNIRGRKLDMMLVYNGIVLCSAEWKSMTASKPVVLKQYVKNLRVNSSILHNLRSCLNDDSTTILGIDWKGLVGYVYIMKKLGDVVVVKEESGVFVPSDMCEFEDFTQSIESLMKFKAYYVGLAMKIKVKAAKDRRQRFHDDHFNITPTTSRSPSPHTFFTPKRPTTTHRYQE